MSLTSTVPLFLNRGKESGEVFRTEIITWYNDDLSQSKV